MQEKTLNFLILRWKKIHPIKTCIQQHAIVITIFLLWACLSAATEKTENIISFSSGNFANCLNGALRYKQILNQERYTSNAEMWSVLESPLCLKVDSSPDEFDIGILIDKRPHAEPFMISHAFVLLKNNKIFEKHGLGEMEPYQYSTVDTVLAEYEGHTLTYYHCQLQDEFKEINPFPKILALNQDNLDINKLRKASELLKSQLGESSNLPWTYRIAFEGLLAMKQEFIMRGKARHQDSMIPFLNNPSLIDKDFKLFYLELVK